MKILGFSEDYTVCEHCGKTNLKGTYAFLTNEGDLHRWGSTCIQKAYRMDKKEFTSKVKADERDRYEAARLEFYSSEAGAFYKSYVGSEQHGKDIDLHGFGYVFKLIKPAKDLQDALELKYGIKYLSV